MMRDHRHDKEKHKHHDRRLGGCQSIHFAQTDNSRRVPAGRPGGLTASPFLPGSHLNGRKRLAIRLGATRERSRNSRTRAFVESQAPVGFSSWPAGRQGHRKRPLRDLKLCVHSAAELAPGAPPDNATNEPYLFSGSGTRRAATSSAAMASRKASLPPQAFRPSRGGVVAARQPPHTTSTTFTFHPCPYSLSCGGTRRAATSGAASSGALPCPKPCLPPPAFRGSRGGVVAARQPPPGGFDRRSQRDHRYR